MAALHHRELVIAIGGEKPDRAGGGVSIKDIVRLSVGRPTRVTCGQIIFERRQSFGSITGTYSPFNYVGASRSDASARTLQMALRFTF